MKFFASLRLLPGAVAAVLFALLAVSVSENAAAQTVQNCSGEGVSDQFMGDPHSNPQRGGNAQNDNCGTDQTERCLSSVPDGIRCGICSPRTSSLDMTNPVRYAFNGVAYCASNLVGLSQCKAVGGTLEDGTVCECDPGNARINGICETADTACAPYETFDQTEDAGRTEFVCRPREEARDCDSSTERFVPDAGGTGGICECTNNYESDGADNCVQCTGGQTSDGGGSSCACADPTPHDRNGMCEARKVPADDCEANEIVNSDNDCEVCGINELRRTGTNECHCPDTHFGEVGSCQETTLPNECGPHEYVEANVCTECGVNEVRGTDGSCEPCQANHVRPAEATSCTCRSDYFTGGGSCVPFLDPADDCEPNQILNRADNSCQNCGDHEVRGADGACDCQQFGEVGSCAPIVEVSTCAPNEHIVENACAECPVNQFRGTESSCTACPQNEVRAMNAASCSCNEMTHYPNTEDGTCDDFAECPGQVRQADNTCATSCGANERLEDGSCECIDGHSRVAEGSCERNCSDTQIRVNNAGACVDRVACAGGTVSAANECMCPNTHEDIEGTCLQLCHENADRQDGTCRCNAEYEGDGFSCAACENGQTSEAGGSCACPMDQRLFTDGCAVPMECGNQVLGPDNTCTDECTGGLLNIGGVCEAMQTCSDTYEYDAPTNRCVCPSGQRENADQTACETIPASGGGGSSGGGGAAAAIIAVPVILIGGYYLLGGFGYVDPYADFSYSGENGNLDWRGNAGFNLQHDGLRSYATAIQSNGAAVRYESGISYERDFLVLDYAALESEGNYTYDLAARVKSGFGPWTISPTAVAEFQYQAGEAWETETSAGVSAAWTAHKWIVRASSAFAGDAGHTLQIRREL